MSSGGAQDRAKSALGVLRLSGEQANLFIAAVQDYAIFMLDPRGNIISWNIGAQRIKGYKADEIVGKHFSVFYPEEDVNRGKPAWELEVAAREGRFEDEGWRIRQDGTRFWANVIITAVRDSTGDLIGFGKVTRDFTERMLAQRTVQDSQRRLDESEKSLRQLSLHLLRTQDQERQRIGRELHDSLGQYLSVLKMKLDSIDISSDGTTTATTEEISDCAELADTCIREVRTISYLLFPPFLEERGLNSAITWYLEGFSKRCGIETTFCIAPDFERLPRETELVLFRVLQESLTNVHRHSGSGTADVRLDREGDLVTLKITDLGKGLSAEMKEQSASGWLGAQGVGLRGMSERVRQVGGTFGISSNGTGTEVCVQIPVTQAPEPRLDDETEMNRSEE